MNGREQDPGKTRAEVEAESRKPPREIEKDVERTRAEMDETLAAIERRFSPGEMVDQAIRYLGSGPREYAVNLGRSLKNNPLPATLTAIGLGWLMASNANPPPASVFTAEGGGEGESSWKEKYGQARTRAEAAATRVRESFGRFSQAMGGGRQAVGEGAGAARERLGGMAAAAGERRIAMRGRVQTMVEEQPLTLLGLGFALGAALGATLPSSEAEDRTLGEKRDELLQQAKEKSREQLEKGREVAAAAGETAREKAGEQQEKEPEPAV